jgi:hypothetical protein
MDTEAKVWLNKELRTFAAMLGRQLNKFPAESWAAEDYTEIAEFRLAQILGMDRSSPEFECIWWEVFERACDYIEGDDDDDAELPGDTPLPEQAYAGLPYFRWEIDACNDRWEPLARFVVKARTSAEADRLSRPDVMRVPRMRFMTMRKLPA